MKCTCVFCPKCLGSGWLSFSGEYLGSYNWDLCPECDGSGIVKTAKYPCDYCRDRMKQNTHMTSFQEVK